MDNTEIEYYEYNRKVTNFGNGIIEVVTYHEPQLRVCGGLGNMHKLSVINGSVISDKAQEARTEKQRHAIKRKIRGYALANEFEWFATLTINPKKQDSLNYDSSKALLLKWCRLMRDKYGKFDYLIVPELHKSGAIHFHALLGNLHANFKKACHPKTGENVMRNNRQVYNLLDWRLGFSDCEAVISPEKTASYVTKYVTKDLMTSKKMFRKKRYFNSQGLKKPSVDFELKDNSDLSNFVPNYGVVETDDNGKNYIDKSIYNLLIDSNTGTMSQTDCNSLLKAKGLSLSPLKPKTTDHSDGY